MGTLTHIQRAALAIKAFPPGFAARVMARLQPDDLTQLIVAFRKTDQAEVAAERESLEELLREINERRQTNDCRISQPAPSETPCRASHGLRENRGGNRTVGQTASLIPDSDRCFWQRLSSEQLRDLLLGEHPKLIAEALARLEPHRAAEVLQGFESPLRISVVRRLCDIETLDQIDDSSIARVLFEKIDSQVQNRLTGGDAQVARTLEHLEPEVQEEIPTLLSADSDSGVVSNRGVLTFEDLANFSDDAMRELLSRADTSLWARALFRADKRIIDRVVECMAPPAAKLLLKEMQETMWVSPADRTRARRALIGSPHSQTKSSRSLNHE